MNEETEEDEYTSHMQRIEIGTFSLGVLAVCAMVIWLLYRFFTEIVFPGIAAAADTVAMAFLVGGVGLVVAYFFGYVTSGQASRDVAAWRGDDQ